MYITEIYGLHCIAKMLAKDYLTKNTAREISRAAFADYETKGISNLLLEYFFSCSKRKQMLQL